MFDFSFFFNCILLGLALAVDAFSVSIANGLSENGRSLRQTLFVSGTFGLFQFVMPLIGWVLVKTFVSFFSLPKFIIPLAAMLILGFLGIKMLVGSRKEKSDEAVAIGTGAVLFQGVATSLDALSVGLTIADYDAIEAHVCSLVIGAVTFALCIFGVILGNKFKKTLSSFAETLGGIILIVIGIEIFIRGMI